MLPDEFVEFSLEETIPVVSGIKYFVATPIVTFETSF